jgi:hypothetical protein
MICVLRRKLLVLILLKIDSKRSEVIDQKQQVVKHALLDIDLKVSLVKSVMLGYDFIKRLD